VDHNIFSEPKKQRLNAQSASFSGIISTLPMTLVLLHPFVKLPEVDICRILGHLFTPVDRVALFLGAILHLLAGILFALSYTWTWDKGLGKVSLLSGASFGAVHGIIASVLMKQLLTVHPRRPQVWGLSNSVIYVAAHIVYGTVVAGLYRPRR
jgi:hypothetical protein